VSLGLMRELAGRRNARPVETHPLEEVITHRTSGKLAGAEDSDCL